VQLVTWIGYEQGTFKCRCAKAQAVSQWLVTRAAWVQTQASPHGGL